jgi:long-chain acyl-CoA synthetase
MSVMGPVARAAREHGDTLPKLLRHNARAHGSDIALRQKDLGIWRSLTWKDYEDLARAWALGLEVLGVKAGDVIAIIGDAQPDWVASAVAVHALRGMTLGLYQDALDDEVAYLLTYAKVRVVIAEDEEQVDKVLKVAEKVPSIEHIVYCDPRGMRKYDDSRLVSRERIMEAASRVHAANPKRWDELVDATNGAETSVLCSTSGTTSRPKLAAINSGQFIPHVANYCDLLGLGPDDEYVSLLPMGWIGEQFLGFFQPIVCRHKTSFPEETETAMADLREIAPTYLMLAPRVWEQIAADVRARMMDASPFKRWIFEKGLKMGLDAIDRGNGSGMAQMLALRALRDRLGFSRLRFATTGGAAMGPDTFKFFMAMGVPLMQLYGQTELGGIYCIHRPGKVDFDTVGRGINDDYKIRIDKPDANGVGEVVTQHPYMFQGYYQNPDATAADLRDGWMHTGDAGYFKPSGELVVIDRLKDLATTRRGDRFSPQFIENKLKFSPYISEAVILGDGRDHLAAIICIRFAITAKWAEQQRMSFTTYSDLSSRPEVYDLIAAQVRAVNASLPPAQQISKFVLLYKELDADDGELTRTRKVRRGVVAEKYANIIDAIYSGAKHVKIDTEIAFQDGSKQRIRTTMPIASLTASDNTSSKAAAA